MALTISTSDPPLAPVPASWPHDSTRQTACDLREPRLSVVIVNYHTWAETDQLVRQLQASEAGRDGLAEIMIVDNHSPLHPLAARLRRRPGVSLRRWGRNHGYARGVNEGCRLSRGDWILLLNPDVSVDPRFLDDVLALAEQLRDDPRAGVVGFHLRNTDGTPQLSAGRFPTLLGTLGGLLRPRSQRKYMADLPAERCRVPWVTGCCFLVRRECLQQLGGFDEDFFLYYEDVDFCRRARDAGWSVWYEPALHVTHHRPLHLREVPAHLRVCTRHALLTYGAKHWARWQFLAMAGVVGLEAWARRLNAGRAGNAESQAHFQRLGELAVDLVCGRTRQARRRLDACVRDWEQRVRQHAEARPAVMVAPAPSI
jgi:GT2 family glycosyltransferase